MYRALWADIASAISTSGLFAVVCLVWLLQTPRLCAPHFPNQVRDANLLARLLVVVEPLALVQLNGLELGIGLLACGKPLALFLSVFRPVAPTNPHTSALNSTNSSPLQSNSNMFFILGGSLFSYAAGAALIFAECSRCSHQSRFASNTDSEKDLTVLALPYKVRLALAAADLVLLEPRHGDPVRVRFAARCALHFEGVIEGRLFRVEGAQVGHAGELGFEG
jgi:hypothetical protein